MPVRRLPQNRDVRASFFQKSQNDQERRGCEAIASLMRHPEFDTHTKLHKRETRRDSGHLKPACRICRECQRVVSKLFG